MGKNLLTKFIIALFLFVLLSTYYILHTTYSLAADAIPDPGNVSCNPQPNSDPEFNSDRPYQASRCGPYNITYWCGNGVVVVSGSVSTQWDQSNCSDTSCQVDYDCTQNGPTNIGGKGGSCKGFQNIIVDLSNVQLPILGNTQLIKNSANPTDQIDDATQVNEYVSNYLNGVTNKAENGIDKNTNDNIVNLSGPLRKLLPGAIQDAARIASINQATVNQTYTTDTDNEQGATTQTVTEPTNHNQIVVCAQNQNGPIIGWISGILNTIGVGSIGKEVPIDCYTTAGGRSNGDSKPKRLSDWNSSSDVTIAINFATKYLVPLIPGIGDILNYTGATLRWEKNIPPLPWGEDPYGKPFTDQTYQKAYNEWRGQLCAFIPNIFNLSQKILVCSGNLIPITNPYADLYPYIPLANTVDKKGVHMVTALVPSAARAQVSLGKPKGYDLIKSPQLYLAHSLENFQLTDLLKKTFVPSNKDYEAYPYQIDTYSTNNDVEHNTQLGGSQCRIIPSRSNSGDDATFGKPKSYIELDNLDIHVSQISCITNTIYVCPVSHPNGSCPVPEVPRKTHDCSSDVYSTIPSVAKYGYADDIFSNTVAGSDSIFRRIYPKTGANAPVSCIADNPAVSKATYTIKSGGDLFRIIEPDQSSVKADGGSAKSIDAQLYYPHYGSVYDYFLKGIQTALRPLGYADPSPESGQNCTNITCGELPQGLPKASGSCTLGGISPNAGKIPNALKQIVEAAAQTYKVPPNLILGVMYGEGAFNTNPDGSYKFYNWTDQNVKNWATCQKIPNCSASADPISSVVPFYHAYWDPLARSDDIISALKKIDPSKTQADPCNLIDVIFVLAKDLHNNAGGGSVTGNKCFGVTMTSTNPTSCTWSDDGQYESAIKIWENGNDPACYTKPGTCLQGNTGSTCPINSTDPTCDTKDNHSSNPAINSHNACVWDVGHGK